MLIKLLTRPTSWITIAFLLLNPVSLSQISSEFGRKSGMPLLFSGCCSLPETGGIYIEIVRFAGSDVQSADWFGNSIALSEDTFLVGAYGEDGGSGDLLPEAGAVYVYERDLGGPGNWGFSARLTASDAQAGDYFGGSVAISGNTIVVGAAGEDGGPGDPYNEAGAAYVFERNQGGPGNWGQAVKLIGADMNSSYGFGSSLDISGDTIVVGAPGALAIPGNPNLSTGATYVFERDLGGPGNWGEANRLTASDGEESDAFGGSVAIDDDFLVVGAWLEDGPSGILWLEFGVFLDLDINHYGLGNRGAAYVFERDQGGPGNWGEMIKLIPTDSQEMDIFGNSVAISGNTAVIAAPGEDGGPGDPLPEAGSVYVFERDQGWPGSWVQSAKLAAGDAQSMDYFGSSVTIHGDTIVIGSSGEDGGPGDPIPALGAVYIYERDLGGQGNWGESGKLAPSDGQLADIFGSSVTINGTLIAAGAIGEDGGPGDPLPGAGAAYLFLKLEDLLFLPITFQE